NDETIDITVQPDGAVQVTGKYHFIRPKKASDNFKITYPFPDPKEFGDVEVKRILVNGKEANPVEKHLRNLKRITLNLFFEGKDDMEMEIVFVQKPNYNHYKYILTTTKTWKKALQKSLITLRLPAGINLDKCSYNVTETDGEEGEKIFRLLEFNFYPDKDFEFSWK
ncbi:MAG TPA: hypothetical protein PLD62_07970, partial [Candidatus Cloacimonadota bacterium]|nr:hypothetical protein [Candidatus Cloacimonadota bacterium]